MSHVVCAGVRVAHRNAQDVPDEPTQRTDGVTAVLIRCRVALERRASTMTAEIRPGGP
jgi:hypothetical protein